MKLPNMMEKLTNLTSMTQKYSLDEIQKMLNEGNATIIFWEGIERDNALVLRPIPADPDALDLKMNPAKPIGTLESIYATNPRSVPYYVTVILCATTFGLGFVMGVVLK